MKILFIGNSFIHRHSRDNSIPHCLSMLGDFEIKESIHEGKGICSFWSDRTIRKKILNAVESFKPQYIVLDGGVPNGSWYVAGLKLINEIKKVSNGKIILLCHHHVGQKDDVTISRCKSLALACGGYALPISKYYSKLKVSYVDTDNLHPTFVCYYIAAVSLYCYLTKKKPSTKATYKSISYDMRKKICDVVASDYGIKSNDLVVPLPTLKRGSKGTKVKKLQKCLNHFGANLKIDGVFGNITRGAFISWESKNNLKPDGIYGKKSYAVMKELLNG